MNLTFTDWLHVLSLGITSGGFVYVLKWNYKLNVVLDRIDILWLEYCKQHKIPFWGLRNKFDRIGEGND